MSRLMSKEGKEILRDGETRALNKSMLSWLMDRCCAQRHRVVWGDWRRVMKRRKDHPTVVAKCLTCGDHVLGADASVPMSKEQIARVDRIARGEAH